MQKSNTDRPNRGARVHIMPWCPQDWLSSPLRGELAMERDLAARVVYRDLLDVLHERGGYLPRVEVAGACLVTPDEAERAVARLLASGRIEETAEGELFNRRVLAGLARERDYREGQARSGGAGGRARAESMTPEQRAEAARRAALARHMRSEPSQVRSEPTHPAKRLRSPPSPSPTPPLHQSTDAEADERMGAREEEEEKVLDILARLRAADQKPTRALRRIVQEVPWDVIEATLHDAWARHVDGLVGNPVAYFQTAVREKVPARTAEASR